MKHFTYEEMELMSIYDPGTREGLIANLEEMRGYLEPDETELRELTDSALEKLRELSDADYRAVGTYPGLYGLTGRGRRTAVPCAIYHPKGGFEHGKQSTVL